MKKRKLVNVVFEPDGREILVPAGTLLSKAAAAAGRPVEMPCGGMGTCGKCRVVVSGVVEDPDHTERRLLTEAQIASGLRLACRTKVVGRITVSIPETSRSMVQKILKHGVLRECEGISGASKVYCELPKPDLDDERAHFERLAAYLEARDIKLKPNLNIVRGMSGLIESSGYKVTAAVYHDELIAVEPGDTSAQCYGMAFDLGTTTVVGYLMDLNTGEEMAVAAVMNPQTIYGDDLVSRVSFATTEENGAQVLQSAAVDTLNRITGRAAKAAGVRKEHIYKATVVGNTCMTHLLLGVDVASLGQSPYVPSVCSDITVKANVLGLDISREASVLVLPNVAGFVGSDLVGVLLSGAWEEDGATRLAVDIGTNGEMALLHEGRIYACSAAAGPAFEGAGIICGMRGAPGAIDSVKITESVEISTIDDRRPIGICGSGLVDAVAEMLDAGIIGDSGRLASPQDVSGLPEAVARRLIETDRGVEFVLATREDFGGRKAISLTSADIRHLQLAKGSIHAAIQTLIRTAGITDEALAEIVLAGAFGNYIKVESAIRIGLIPPVAKDNVKSVGNAAGAGARLALLCDREMQHARTIARRVEHLELAVSPYYQMELMDRMMFPSEAVPAQAGGPEIKVDSVQPGEREVSSPHNVAS